MNYNTQMDNSSSNVTTITTTSTGTGDGSYFIANTSDITLATSSAYPWTFTPDGNGQLIFIAPQVEEKSDLRWKIQRKGKVNG